MKALLHITRTEVLEHWRQPSLLVALVLTYMTVFAVSISLLGWLDGIAADPNQLATFYNGFSAMGLGSGEEVFKQLVDAIFQLSYPLVFTEMPLMVGTFASYGVLHDRLHHTLPFVMLAPISRTQLLTGKILGALVLPMVLHLVMSGLHTLICSDMAILASYDTMLGGSAAWWIAYLLGVPASAALVGAIGALVSALAPDVRSSYQWVGVIVLPLSFGIVAVVQLAQSQGPEVQLAFVAACLMVSAGLVALGGRMMSRDVGP